MLEVANLKQEGEFKFIEQGEGKVMLLLHGLFGALSNWESVIEKFSADHRIIIPMLPIYELPVREAGLPKLIEYLEDFIAHKNLDNFDLMGNSLGGHMALMYILKHPKKVDRLILTGSSGLFENAMGSSFPKRGNYSFIEEKVRYTFYDPNTATKEYIDEIFNTMQSMPMCLRIVGIAKSAQRNNLATELHKIENETLLIWGLNDTITPPRVGHEFNRLLKNSTLRFIDKCCHAPMMERPDEYNIILEEFLNERKSA
ncbi:MULTISPECIES: alpha/beta fold hydrolase [Reichenbachiella]|uniref:Pimeloyl-ACP methyl ester carboxylesterase n=1 Tax=Reichenbachiella agariperforans TaxID=156994 RepID=A0A1M6TWI4_REIAG|nr:MULTISPECIES: alpha/beta hydrolase [Reichenbachiella]MBU2915601.1 alpha/beta hydrolase [Reichenbachiella agariperforans]RJE71338.1 alpha/beta hydrolase [Reichenbachiella sp. MSK19-1]SHK61250.1 Pimeloyl-ACP methyl ester carboxylesterase [Reichenbachiella agariperforans]